MCEILSANKDEKVEVVSHLGRAAACPLHFTFTIVHDDQKDDLFYFITNIHSLLSNYFPLLLTSHITVKL